MNIYKYLNYNIKCNKLKITNMPNLLFMHLK